MNPKVLLIDSDARLLRDAEYALRAIAGVTKVQTAEQATAVLRDQRSYSVIVSCLALPGLDGGLLQSWLRELHPDSIRVLWLGRESLSTICHAINHWSPFRVLAKPFTTDRLRRIVAEAIAEHQRLRSERRVIEETMHASLEAIAAMLSVVQPAAFGRAVRLRSLAKRLAERVGIPDTWQIQIAALVSQFGTLSLPTELVERLCHNHLISAGEHDQLQASMDATLHLLEPIPRMPAIIRILRSIDLMPPNDLHGAEMTPQSGDAERVLTLVVDFDGLFSEKGSVDGALRVMESHIGRYYVPYFDVLRELVGADTTMALVDTVLADVQMGQVFAADVRSPNDLLLVARGQPVTSPILFKIHHEWHDFALHLMVRMVERMDHAEAGPSSVGQAA